MYIYFSLGTTIKTGLKNTNNHTNKIRKRTLKVQRTTKAARFEGGKKGDYFPHGIFVNSLKGAQLEDKAAIRTCKNLTRLGGGKKVKEFCKVSN